MPFDFPIHQEFVGDCSFADYASDKMRRSAGERQLEVLGEACGRLIRLEADLVTTITNLKLAVDLRNRIIHGYDAVDDEIAYFTVKDDLPPLRRDLKKRLDSLAPGPG